MVPNSRAPAHELCVRTSIYILNSSIATRCQIVAAANYNYSNMTKIQSKRLEVHQGFENEDYKATAKLSRYVQEFSASGVKVDASCKNAYDLLHNKHQHSYIIFKIDKNDTAIVVEKVGEKNAPYSEFVEELRKLVEDGKECRYAAVDVEVTVQRQGAEGASTLNKVIFVQYCPDNAPVRRRMLYASSVRALKASLGLESLFQVQASEMSDLDEKVVKSDLMSHQRT